MMRKILFLYCLLAGLILPASAGVQIRGKNFGNWFLMDSDVQFTAKGELSPDAVVSVKLFDGAGSLIHTEELSGKTFLEQGWFRRISEPGYYEVEFSCNGKILSESFTAEVIKNSAEDRSKRVKTAVREIPILRHGFMVAPAPTRKPADIAPVFSSSPHMELYKNALPLAALVGFHSIRLHAIPWSVVEQEPGKYDWRYPDDVMRVANECGFANENIIINTFNTPRWASSHPDENWFDNCVWAYSSYAPADLKYWENYLRELLTRYRGIKGIELLNEPNFPGFSCFWHDTPENYFKMIRAGYRVAKEIDPAITVMLGAPYVPYYERFLRSGGGEFFDVLTYHSRSSGPKKYREIEEKLNIASRRTINSEWHACLINPGTETWPTDRELSRTMLIHFLRQVHQGVEEICLFSIMNIWNSERESLQFYRDNQQVTSHVSGLFRRAPYVQPRYQAAAWHILSSLIRGKLRTGKGYRFTDGISQDAQLLHSAGEDLLIVWNNAAFPAAPHADILRAAAGRKVLRADGSPVNDFPSEKLATDIYYIIVAPDLEAINGWKNEAELLKEPEEQNLLSQKWKSHYLQKNIFDKNLRQIRKVEFTPIPQKQISNTEAKAADIKAQFAVALTEDALELLVQVRDNVHFSEATGTLPWDGDSIQFCVDTRGKGIFSDQVEFIAHTLPDGKGILRKIVAPAIGGDLPTRFTHPGPLPGNRVQYASWKITRQNNVTTYCIRLDLAELYPLIFQPGDPLRFSILVNNNDGSGRAAYWEWSSGIGGLKQPQDYGTLLPHTGKGVFLKQENLKIPGWQGDFTITYPGKAMRIDTNNSVAAGVRTGEAELTPGGSYRLRFSARGNLKFLLVKAAGKDVPMFDVTPQILISEEWKEFEYLLTLPKNGKFCAIFFLAWDQKGCFFEIKDFVLESL